MKSSSKKELERENRLLKLLLSTITHDIVGPLGFTANVLQASADNPSRELLKELSFALRTSYDKSSEILSFLRNGWGKDIFEKEEIEINNIVDSVIKAVNILYPHSIFNREDSHSINIKTSRTALYTALENIFTNAAKYTSRKETITISITQTNDITTIYTKAPCSQEACISVIDTLNDKEPLKRNSRTSIGLQISHALLSMCDAQLSFSYENGCFISRIDIPR